MKTRWLAKFGPRLLLGISFSTTFGVAMAQQVADLSYNPPIAQPAYEEGKGPHVAIDAAHNNFHTADGRYQPFAALLRRDGYRVDGLTRTATARRLKGVDVLVIANALAEKNVGDWSLPTPSAFSAEEAATIRKWVEGGGSLFLIADHMPFPGAVSELADAFGIEFSNGYAQSGTGEQGKPDIYSPENGLRESPVTRGRSDSETVTSVATFTGSAFKPPTGASPVLVFGPNSISHETTKAPGVTEDAPRKPVDGWCQGAIWQLGKGRIAVFGEAAMFSAQSAGPEKNPMGMNAPSAEQNHQLLLNVLHWLTRVKGMPELG